MNSKQRRKDRRLWKYKIKIVAKDFDHYAEMWDWLAINYGKIIDECGWRVKFDLECMHAYDEYMDTVWIFNDKRKATEFTLRWA